MSFLVEIMFCRHKFLREDHKPPTVPLVPNFPTYYEVDDMFSMDTSKKQPLAINLPLTRHYGVNRPTKSTIVHPF